MTSTQPSAISMESAQGTPRNLGTPHEVYDSVLDVLASLDVESLLDCAAGQGAFASRTQQSGYTVSCCDILPEQFRADGIDCQYANLNERIPFPDESFDAVTCLNSLQRVWARGRALHEMARVLKPGGHLIVSLFNNNNLMRRAMFLLSGSIISDTIGPPYAFVPDEPDPASSFRHPITVADTLAAAESVGLELRRLEAVVWSKGSLLLAPLALVPLLLQPLLPQRYRDHCRPREASAPGVLFKDCLVFVVRKGIGRSSCVPARSDG